MKRTFLTIATATMFFLAGTAVPAYGLDLGQYQNQNQAKAKKGNKGNKGQQKNGPNDGTGNKGAGPQDGTGYGAKSGKRGGPMDGSGPMHSPQGQRRGGGGRR